MWNNLLDENGDVFSYSDFCGKFDFDCNPKSFKCPINSIPNVFIILANNTALYSQSPSHTLMNFISL